MARIYLDSCIVIYILESPEDRGEQILEKLSPQEESNTLYVSDLTEMECMVRPLRVGKKEVIETYRAFFQRTTIHYGPLSKEVFRTATRLRANFNLKTPMPSTSLSPSKAVAKNFGPTISISRKRRASG